MSSIPDITPSEEWVVKTSLRERYQKDIEQQFAYSEIRLSASDRELTSCPVIFWQVDDCNFSIFKTRERKHRCPFFYKPCEPFGTGVRGYDDLTECTISRLQAQADQTAEKPGELEKKTPLVAGGSRQRAARPTSERGPTAQIRGPIFE